MAATVLGPESGEEPDRTYGLPGARLANALREWQVTELPGDYYQMLNASDGDIVTLFKAFGIDVPAKMYTRKRDLRIFNWQTRADAGGLEQQSFAILVHLHVDAHCVRARQWVWYNTRRQQETGGK